MRYPPHVNRFSAAFFALTFLLSAPFYILNALAHLNIVGRPEMGAFYIALFTATPIASASLLTFRKRGARGLKKLLGRIFDFRRIAKNRWYAAIFLLSPLIFVLSAGGMVLAGTAIPPAMIPLAALPAVLPFFFLLAAGEEVGWMGYAFEPMQARHGALITSLLLGVIWAFWHLPFFVFMMPNLVVLTAQIIALVGTRVLVAWIFNNTGVETKELPTWADCIVRTRKRAIALFVGFELTGNVRAAFLKECELAAGRIGAGRDWRIP